MARVPGTYGPAWRMRRAEILFGEVMNMSAEGSADLRGQAMRIARSAGMAPSHHNSQPWSLSVGTDVVEVWAERQRRPVLTDPAGRQALIGIGAAVYAIRLELAELGFAARVEPFPDQRRPALAARVRAEGRPENGPYEHLLWQQLPRRRTVRARMEPDVPVPLRRALALHVAVEGCGLRWVDAEPDRRALAALIALAEREQHDDPLLRGELSEWTSAQMLAAGAGVPAYALGPSGAAGHAAQFPHRDFRGGPPGGGSALRPEREPAVAVLVSTDDTAADWLRAGQALMRMLLVATAEGLAASYLNQPLEDRGLRVQVRSELALPGPAQMVIRLGRPNGIWPPAPPRRPAAELIREEE
jgi:nitroreductase